MTAPDDLSSDLLSLSFAMHSNPGAYALLVGAGVSAGHVPTAWDVRVDLTSKVAEMVGEETAEPIDWYTARFGQSAEYEQLLERLAPTPLERQKLLRQYFEPVDEAAPDVPPTKAHEAIARLVLMGSVRVIITLNFDRLIERALRAVGVEPVVIASPADVLGMAPLHTIRCCVIHLHGDYLSPASMLNTRDELAGYAPEMQGLLRRVLAEYGLVIAGWSSVYDPALRAAVQQHASQQFSMTWIEPFEQHQLARELLAAKRGTLVRAGAGEGFGRLADAVASMRTRRARHPLTVTVAAETARRELSGRWVAIELHDTLGAEFERLHTLPDLNLPNHDTPPEGGAAGAVARIREAAEVPAALTAALAYWGTGDTDSWWMRELPRFAVPADGSGSVELLALRQHVGAGLYWAAGVATVAAGRFELLGSLFRLRAPRLHEPHDELLADRLDGRVPFDWLSPILQSALSISRPALEEAWQVFEILRLAHIVAARDMSERFEPLIYILSPAAHSSAEDKAAAQRQYDEEIARLAQWVPMVRPHLYAARLDLYQGHRLPVAERLLRELDREVGRHPLVTSGVGNFQALKIAIRATSVAAAVAVQREGWRRDRVWLDSASPQPEY